MALFDVHMELARTPEFPSGSRAHGYDLVLPLSADGHLDLDGWQKNKRQCAVRRFWAGEDTEVGQLVRTRGGAWAFSYEPGEEDDEPVYRLADHVFSEGEYVSVREHDGVTRTFRIISVTAKSA